MHPVDALVLLILPSEHQFYCIIAFINYLYEHFSIKTY